MCVGRMPSEPHTANAHTYELRCAPLFRHFNEIIIFVLFSVTFCFIPHIKKCWILCMECALGVAQGVSYRMLSRKLPLHSLCTHNSVLCLLIIQQFIRSTLFFSFSKQPLGLAFLYENCVSCLTKSSEEEEEGSDWKWQKREKYDFNLLPKKQMVSA